MKPTVAVMGGSFNPPHVGHALVAGWLGWSGRADEVALVPSHQHPFGRSLAPFERRVAMCQALAHAIGPWVTVEPIEATLPAPNYTFDMLCALAAGRPDVDFRLVIGADVLADLPRWHRWPEIEARFSPIVVGRQGYPTPPGTVDFPNVSSTEVRRRLAIGEPVDALLTAEVMALLGDCYPRWPGE